MTWSILLLSRPASWIACSNGPLQACNRSAVSSWKRARESVSSRCNGPSLVAVMNGRLIDVSWRLESSIFAFSPASFSRCDGHLVVGEVDAVRVLELGDHPVDDALVPVVATEVRVAGGRLDLEHAVADLEHRHVERAAAEVEDEDRLVAAFLVEPVRERGRGGLVDDAQHLEARDLAGLLGGLALGVVEVRGHGDDGLVDRLAEVLPPRRASASAACGREISCALYAFPSMSIDQLVPMWRLTERIVRSGLVIAWRLATSPTSTSPVFENATTDGVVRAPSALGMTAGSPASSTATTELVVPRSIPTALDMGSSEGTDWAGGYAKRARNLSGYDTSLT